MRLTGDPNRSVELYHQFRPHGKYGDRFLTGGWCCAFLKGKRGADDGICRIKVQFSVGGTTWLTDGLIDFNNEEGNLETKGTENHGEANRPRGFCNIDHFPIGIISAGLYGG